MWAVALEEQQAQPKRAVGYSLQDLLSMAARPGPGWPARWPRRAGFEQPANGFLIRLWLGPAPARLLMDEELAAVLCRMIALPAATVPASRPERGRP